MPEQNSFSDVRSRLDEIVDEVAREGITLDEALALYEEAVQLGLRACDLSEQDLHLNDEPEADAEESSEPAAGQEGEGSSNAESLTEAAEAVADQPHDLGVQSA